MTLRRRLRDARRRARHLNLSAAVVLSLFMGVAVCFLAYGVLNSILPVGADPLQPKDVTSYALAIAAGIGAMVALVVSYRRQRDLEQGVFVERFGAAAKQLGDADAAVRIAGVYAMAGVADETSGLRRQQCVDVLCGYLRLPYSPRTGGNHQQKLVVRSPAKWDGSADELHFQYRQNDKEVRQTIVRVVSAHLQLGVDSSWSDCDYDLTGVHFEDADFTGAAFRGRRTDFSGATFNGTATRFFCSTFYGAETSFAGATFDGDTSFEAATFRDSHTYFDGAKFCGGRTSFDMATFRACHTSFDWAEFNGAKTSFFGADFAGAGFDGRLRASIGQTSFEGATFSGPDISFEKATFAQGRTSFDWANFSGPHVSFERVEFSAALKTAYGHTSFDGATFSGNTTFEGARFMDVRVSFNWATFKDGTTSFLGVDFETSHVTFENPKAWDPPPLFDWDRQPTGERTAFKPEKVKPDDWPPRPLESAEG